jgi:hypothetical protein
MHIFDCELIYYVAVIERTGLAVSLTQWKHHQFLYIIGPFWGQSQSASFQWLKCSHSRSSVLPDY